MNLIDAVKIIRTELLIKDEPLKAYNLLKELNLSELDTELKNSYGTVAHIFDNNVYQKVYGHGGEDLVKDCEIIEPRSLIKDARGRYPRYDWMISEMDSEKAKSYMDLACYVGSLVTTASAKGLEAIGVDMTKESIKVAMDRANSENLKCDFYCDDVTKFNKRKADLVSAFEVIEHVVDPKQFVNHLCSLANKWVYITTPNRSYGNGEGNIGHWDWDGNEVHARGHVRVFSKQSMMKLLLDCNCEIGFIDTMPDGLIWAKFRKGK